MKKILLTITVVCASALTMLGQGRVNFNNLVSGNAITITANGSLAAPGEGAAGAFIGADYSVELLWAAGTFADLTSFLAATPSSSTPAAFFGATGGNPGSDGAGLFDGGTVAMNGAAGTYTMLARAWYNNGTFSTYAAAVSGGANVGDSGLFSQAVTAPPTGVNNTIFPSFTVASVPEPTSFALAGLGAAALMIFRRKK